MAAPAVPTIEQQIREKFWARPEPAQNSRLIFTFDGLEFSTRYEFSRLGMRNGCVNIMHFEGNINYNEYENNENDELFEGFPEPPKITSSISANSPAKNCFTPLLTHDLIRPTSNLLQTLSTKIKFALLDDDEIEIIDKVHLLKGDGTPYTSQHSFWRLIRDEPTVYEKFGYESTQFNRIREIARIKRWRDIKDTYIFEYKGKLGEIIDRHYADKGIRDDETIAEAMRKITYEQSEVYIAEISIPNNPTEYKTIIDFVFESILALDHGLLGEKFTGPRLTIRRNSPIWRSWDERLQFRSFEPIAEGGGKRTRHQKRRGGRRSGTRRHRRS